MNKIVNKETRELVFWSEDVGMIEAKHNEIIKEEGSFDAYEVIFDCDDEEQTSEDVEYNKVDDFAKVYIRGYGNLTLKIMNMSEIGIETYSERNEETLFIPWTSIIMISDKVRLDAKR